MNFFVGDHVRLREKHLLPGRARGIRPGMEGRVVRVGGRGNIVEVRIPGWGIRNFHRVDLEHKAPVGMDGFGNER